MSGSLKKILVIDDNIANLTVINGILNTEFKVYPVDSGAVALKFLEKQRPDLILLDVEMPEMTGTELFSIVKKDRNLSDIPIIFLTGNRDMDSEEAAFSMGATDFIRKPISDIIILTRVRMHLELDAYRKAVKSLHIKE